MVGGNAGCGSKQRASGGWRMPQSNGKPCATNEKPHARKSYREPVAEARNRAEISRQKNAVRLWVGPFVRRAARKHTKCVFGRRHSAVEIVLLDAAVKRGASQP